MSGDQLSALYSTSSLLVVPSLVEGFGQVYLEALARGCPVLGTQNTCLPDLGDETQGVFLSAVGNPAHLASRLEELSKLLPGNRAIRVAGWQLALRYSWDRFRAGLVAALA